MSHPFYSTDALPPAKRNWLEKFAKRERFSQYLPWVTYDERYCTYLLQDGWYGYIWRTNPLPLAGDESSTTLRGLLSIKPPSGSVSQYGLVADAYIEDRVDRYVSLKTRTDQVVRDNVQAFRAHIMRNASRMSQLHGIPLRNYWSWIAMKSPIPLSDDLLSTIDESLSLYGAHRMHADGDFGLLAWMRRFFGDQITPRPGFYDERQELRGQIIDAGYPVEFGAGGDDRNVRIGSHYARCLTPKTLPKAADMLKMNRLVGGYGGVNDDPDQVTSPWMFVTTIYHDDVAADLGKKAQTVMAQKATGTIAAKIGRMAEEMMWALGEADETPFVRVAPTIWTFGETPKEAGDGVARIRRLWEKEGFLLQEESYLTRILLPSSLPLGALTGKVNARVIDRDFPMPVSAAACFVPFQADFRGFGEPAQLLVGRKGQLIELNVFDERLNNRNFLVCAESGAGKSFLLNNMLRDYYAAGAKVRIIDIGYSYKKSCRMMGGRFIDIGDDAEPIVLNPFDTGRVGSVEDVLYAIQMAAAVIQLMVTSATKSRLTEVEVNIIKSAVQWVFKHGRRIDGIDAVREYLADFEKHAEEQDRKFEEAPKIARELSFNLRSFAKDGEYGKYFNGKSTLYIAEDDWLVLELESLKDIPQLFAVIVVQVLNLVTQDLYLSDRTGQRFILFEEAAAFLKQSLGGDMTELFAEVIEAGFRRARKYNGSMGVVLQSVLDLESFGSVGTVLWENSATKFLLQGKSYTKASAAGVIPYKGFALELLNSVQNVKPNYSEVFIHSDLGMGVARLVVDPHSYWINTSHGPDVARYTALVQAGYSAVEAIGILVEGADAEALARAPKGRLENQQQDDTAPVLVGSHAAE